MKRAILLLSTALVLAFTSCGGAEPEIAQLAWQLNYRLDPQLEDVYEELSVFLHISDEDGVDDIENIHIIHDTSELYWTLNENNWHVSDRSDEYWIGSNTIRNQDYSELPRGGYRLLVTDTAGERTEEAIFIAPDKEADPDSFPEIIEDEGTYSLHAPLGAAELWSIDSNNAFRDRIGSLADTSSLNAQIRPGLRVLLYSYHSETNTGYITGPYEY
ncbi:MAG: hypothetical protein ACLFR1_12985 [Spirochaetia bacterium]